MIIPHVIRTDLQPGEFRQYIIDLGEQYNIVFVRSYVDDIADMINHVVGDDIQSDGVRDLLIALKRAGVLGGKDWGELLIGYLREQDGLDDG